jgi:site-specific recombinase XerD
MERGSPYLAGEPPRVPVTGPLAPFAVGMRAWLTQQGFTRHVVTQHTHLLAHLSAWLAGHELAPARLCADELGAYLLCRRAEGHRVLISARGMAPLLRYLRDRGAIPEPGPPTPSGPVGRLLSDYHRYLVAERGLAPLSSDRYLGAARLFLSGLPEPLEAAVGGLSAEQVTDFLVEQACQRRVWAAKSLVTALRSLLRFLHVTGLLPRPLVAAVALGALPRAVGDEQVAALLGSCDRSTPLGRRDYAILLALSRLGLRNGEIAALELDDIDWRAGQLLVRGKGNRSEALPLPSDVGPAIVDYLTDGRPLKARCRKVFVIGRAPFSGLSLSGVTSIVVAACDRAHSARVSPHRLRHTVASGLLAHGAPLIEVGQLLRHKDESTTAIYAKLDHLALGALVRSWPGAS